MTSFTAKRQSAAWLLALLLLLPAAARADYAAELAKMKSAQTKDIAQHELQAGLAAMAEGKTKEATELFDLALTSIESIFANTENAAKARSLWYEEGAKEFKGEPYERSMAFYYRGLLYLTEGDYENARASFRSGILQDAFAEDQQFRSDFSSLMLLEGWANQLNGDTSQASSAYGEVQSFHPGWGAPKALDNFLIVAELGGSPRKLSDGISNHEIVYKRPKRTPEHAITVDLDGKALRLALVEDLFFQASTRGGRPIDRVIDGKVAFQNKTEAIGSALGIISSEGSVLGAAFNAGGGRALGTIAAVGAISSLISVNVKPKADVRFWANLPETLHIASVSGTDLPHKITATLFDADGKPVALDQVQIHSWIDKNGNGLIWIKSRN